MNKLIVILGPTGVGKTDLCLKIAEQLDTPIINADSRQVFKELPIGTAAPTEEQQSRVKHYFVGNLHINDYYSASMFENDVMDLLPSVFENNTYALMSGGSMMYIDAVCNGIDDIPTVDEKTRMEVKHKFDTEGLKAISEELEMLDPEYYKIVDRNNHKRIVHAVEICRSTGRTYTSFRKNIKKERPFEIIKIGLNRDRSELYSRIDQRVDQMIADGLVAEAEAVYPMKGLNALNTVGYKEIFDYFDGKCTLEDAIFKIKCNTHKYCRKQLTWFKRDEQIRWFSPLNVEEIIKYIYSYN
ncbi:MAG: tRNA (adenosine(37)-N6)-dimethylallyltransferase MiaA [Prevotellaceae bacterium]|nr:tRNA (adenosine(37)-N6)-dimethylallyltransferase MiaA [Prevotellaceae bacterium]